MVLKYFLPVALIEYAGGGVDDFRNGKTKEVTLFFFFSSKGVFSKILGHPSHNIGSTHTALFSFR